MDYVATSRSSIYVELELEVEVEVSISSITWRYRAGSRQSSFFCYDNLCWWRASFLLVLDKASQSVKKSRQQKHGSRKENQMHNVDTVINPGGFRANIASGVLETYLKHYVAFRVSTPYSTNENLRRDLILLVWCVDTFAPGVYIL